MKTSPKDLLTAFKCTAVACLDPDGTCLTVVVREDSPTLTGIEGGQKTDPSNPETMAGPA